MTFFFVKKNKIKGNKNNGLAETFIKNEVMRSKINELGKTCTKKCKSNELAKMGREISVYYGRGPPRRTRPRGGAPAGRFRRDLTRLRSSLFFAEALRRNAVGGKTGHGARAPRLVTFSLK